MEIGPKEGEGGKKKNNEKGLEKQSKAKEISRKVID